MRRLALVVVGIALTITGCGGPLIEVNPESDTAPKVEVPAAPETSSGPSEGTVTDAEGLARLRANVPNLELVSDSELLKLAEAACGALDRGASIREVIETMLDSVNGSDAGSYLGFAVLVRCPEYTEEAQAWSDSVT